MQEFIQVSLREALPLQDLYAKAAELACAELSSRKLFLKNCVALLSS